ncbi:MAG: hypothetical protein K6T88_11950 [Bacillus sp. (in: Bacteria)]|nr:hypothetical protein [Bacillus sp. (in: firmicutes)]
MNRDLPIKSLLVVGMGATAATWLSSKPNRLKVENVLRDWKRNVFPSSIAKSDAFPVEKGGNPHPSDEDDNNMVSEGAMYSVKFFNENVQ